MTDWPYDDLVLRTPHCPWCGAQARILVGQNLHPMAWCPDDECQALSWDPTQTAKRLIENATRLVQEELPDGSIRLRPGD